MAETDETLLPREIVADTEEDVVFQSISKRQTERKNHTTRTIFVVSAILGVMIAIGVAGKSVVKHYTMAAAMVDGELAVMVASMNTSVNPCESPWNFACGGYVEAEGGGASTLGAAQQRVYRDVWSFAATQSQWGWKQFLVECRDIATYEAQHPETIDLVSGRNGQWLLDAGLVFAGASLSQGRDEDLVRRERVPVLTDHVSPGPCVYDFECPTANVSFVPVDEPLCVASSDVDALCDRLTEANLKVLRPSLSWCVREAIELWPSSISSAWMNEYSNIKQYEGGTVNLFNSLRQRIAKTLYHQRQKTLAQAVESVSIRLKHSAPPEQYRVGLGTFAEKWGKTRIQRHAADMSLKFYTPEQWSMPATAINAYYDGLFNSVYVTPAIIRALWSDNYETRVAKLGFVIAHEIGHSIHSQDLRNVPIGSKAAFTAGRDCLIDEYNVNGSTVHEDMADRVATSAVANILGTSKLMPRMVCNGECVETTTVSRAIVQMAQVWCSSPPGKRYAYDPHSPNKDRVEHSLVQTSSIMEALGCKPLPVENVCTVIGA